MAKKLTAKTIENLRPSPQRREISDGGSGLFLILQPSGARSWAVRYRYDGRPAKLTLGPWPTLTLAAARKGAADALHELANGLDPGKARKAAKQKAAESEANTVAAICAEFLQREGRRLRTVDQRESTLRRLVYPFIGERPIDSLKRSEIVRLLDRIEDNSGPRMADVTLGVLRRIFNWHALRSDEFRSPIVRGMGRLNPAEHRRSRILNDDELRRLWAATADGQPFSNLIRFLLLTGSRRGEAAGLTWAEITDSVWTLPASRSKTKTEVIRPLSQAAQAVLAAQPRGDLPWVFTTAGRGPLRSFSDPKAKLDAASGVAGYRIHDLRRSARSLLSRAGVAPDIAERALGHAMPTIRATYDRHSYVDEMVHAFEALATLIDRIVNPPDAAVLPFRR
jgi:integrase